MTKLLLPLPFILLAACAADQPAESTTSELLSKADLEGSGFTCTDNETPYGTVAYCTHCDSDDHCELYLCDSNGCDLTYKNYVGKNTYDYDLNYWFEAESAMMTKPMATIASSSASNGSYIAVPATAGVGGTARITFTAPIASNVMYLWARVITPSTSSNSVRVSIDGVGPLWTLPVHTDWAWERVPAASWNVSAATHTIAITRDEADVRIDRLLLTANPDFVPVATSYQAESAAVVAPMQVAGSILTTRYIYAPVGSGSGGRAQLQTPQAQNGHYAAWGLVQAPSTASNALSIAHEFDALTPWELPLTGTAAWAWSKAPLTFNMTSDSWLTFGSVENGSKLDRVLVTNDPGFKPVVEQMANTTN